MRQLLAHARVSLIALVKQTRVQHLMFLAGVVVATLAAVYGAGWRARGAHDHAQAYKTARQQIVDTITIVKRELVHDSILVHDTRTAMDTARKRFTRSDVRIKIIGDAALSIDNGPPATRVPAVQVIGEIETAREMHRTDSIAYAAVVTQLEHETTRGDLERKRADLVDGELRKTSGRKLGFKSGVAVGVLLLAGAKLLLSKL